MSRFELAGRTVAVTGSTGGLGSALATALGARGTNLALLDLDRDAVRARAATLGTASESAGYVADVRDLSSVQSAMDAARDHFGRLDVVVANAGIGTIGPLATLDPMHSMRSTDVNLNGVWRTFRAALPHVVEQHGYLPPAISSTASAFDLLRHRQLGTPKPAGIASPWFQRHLGVAQRGSVVRSSKRL